MSNCARQTRRPLTWAPPLNPAARFSGPFTRDTVLPTIRNALRQNERIETFPYGNFIAQDSIERGWFTYDHRPRFGTNYYGLRGRMAILSEAYSHDPFRKRIASTYSFVSEALSFIAGNHEDVLEVGREADRRTTAFASTLGSAPSVPIRSCVRAFSTNRAIAAALFVSTHTVDSHLRHVFAKLRISSRVQLATIVAKQTSRGGG